MIFNKLPNVATYMTLLIGFHFWSQNMYGKHSFTCRIASLL